MEHRETYVEELAQSTSEERVRHLQEALRRELARPSEETQTAIVPRKKRGRRGPYRQWVPADREGHTIEASASLTNQARTYWIHEKRPGRREFRGQRTKNQQDVRCGGVLRRERTTDKHGKHVVYYICRVCGENFRGEAL